MFYKALRHDIREGTLRTKRAWLIPLMLFSLLAFRCLYFAVAISNYTFGMLLFEVIGGKAYVSPDTGLFQFPTLWVLIYSLSCFVTSIYPLQDMLGIGGQLLMRTERRRTWWRSKMMWVVLQTVLFFLIGYAVLIIGCLCSGISLSLSVERGLIYNLMNVLPPAPEPILRGPLLFMGLPILFAVCLNLFQMMLSLVLPVVVSYSISLIPLIGASVIRHPVWVGNYAMAMRYAHVDGTGIDVTKGMAVLLVICVILWLIGEKLFQRYDIMPRRIDD